MDPWPWTYTCPLLSSLGTLRSAARKALLLFLGSIFFGSSPPSADAPSIFLSSLCLRMCVSVRVHACSCVPSAYLWKPVRHRANLKTLSWREALWTDGRYAAPLLFCTPSPLFPDPSSHPSHHQMRHERICTLIA